MSEINVELRISRIQSSKCPDRMTICLTDELSRCRFVEVSLTLEQFAQAITSLTVNTTAEVRGLDRVGKTKVIESRKIEIPESMADTASREEIKEWLAFSGKEDGWIVDTYIGEQGSLTREGGKLFANYKVYRFAEQQDGE